MTEPEIRSLPWWERERMLTDKDRDAIHTARCLDWTEINPDSAETIAGKIEIKNILTTKYHREETSAGIE